jgi:hypothetical protein
MTALDEFGGTDAICAAILDGDSMTAIAARVGVSFGSLSAYIASNAERSARVREARTITALLWDEKAEQRIDGAADEFELAKAKDLAHHFRWRAAKIAPKQYGDKIDVTTGGDSLNLSAEERAAKLQALAALAAKRKAEQEDDGSDLL